MSEVGPVRVPLQSGATAWNARVAIAARLVPGVLIAGYLVWITTRVFRSVTSGPGSSMPGWVAILLLLVGGGFGLVLLFSSLSLHAVARRAAPSDLLVTAEGFRIAGGAHDGLAVAWRDGIEVKLVRRPAPAVDGGWRYVRAMVGAKLPETELVELRVVAVGVGGTTIAVALDPAEQRALAAVANWMNHAMREARGGKPPAGAIGGRIPRALHAPTARLAGRVIFGVGWGLLALWPVAFAGVWVAGRGALASLDIVALGAVVLATVAAVLLIGAVVRPLAIARARHAIDAEIASGRRMRGRGRLTAGLAAAALLGLGALAVWRVRHDPFVTDSASRCAAGDVQQCTQLAHTLRARGLPDRAAAVLAHACDPHSSDEAVVDACVDLALMLSDTLFESHPRWPARDFARAEALLSGACGHGSRLACKSRDTLCQSRQAPPACSSR